MHVDNSQLLHTIRASKCYRAALHVGGWYTTCDEYVRLLISRISPIFLFFPYSFLFLSVMTRHPPAVICHYIVYGYLSGFVGGEGGCFQAAYPGRCRYEYTTTAVKSESSYPVEASPAQLRGSTSHSLQGTYRAPPTDCPLSIMSYPLTVGHL